jgi:hypothetical protein
MPNKPSGWLCSWFPSLFPWMFSLRTWDKLMPWKRMTMDSATQNWTSSLYNAPVKCPHDWSVHCSIVRNMSLVDFVYLVFWLWKQANFLLFYLLFFQCSWTLMLLVHWPISLQLPESHLFYLCKSKGCRKRKQLASFQTSRVDMTRF